GGLRVALGHGDGTFAAPVAYTGAIAPLGVAIGDLNFDGKPDLAVASIGSAVSVFLGHGDGTFAAAGTSGSGVRQNVVVAGLNVDGKPDLAATTNSGSVEVFLGHGDGTFAAPVSYTADLGQNTWGLAVADFNRDGLLDLAASGQNTGNVTVFLGHGNGTFA